MGRLLILNMTLYSVLKGGAGGGLLRFSLKKSMHVYLSSFISFVKKAFVYSFKTFYKLEKTATLFSVHYK